MALFSQELEPPQNPGRFTTACIGVLAILYLAGIIMLDDIKSSITYLVTNFLIMAGSIFGFSYCILKFGRDEFFSLKRRPIRFHRKEKKIYAIRRRRFFSQPGQGDITWEVPWDETAIFCIHRGSGRHSHTYHIRHYEVDEAGNVIRAFSIGRKWVSKENIQDLLAQWNYWCSYMNHGPAELPKPPLFFKEHENALESFLFCLYDIGTRAPVAYRIALMPHILIMTGYRLMALWTCRDPIWPDFIERVSAISHEDPYDEPGPKTPVGWAQTVHALERNEYPNDPKCDVPNWSGEKNPALNALLWAEDLPPRR